MALRNRETPDECLIQPMSGDVESEHIINAFIVGAIAGITTLAGQSVSSIVSGGSAIPTFPPSMSLVYTSVLAFFLTFFAMWAKARGINSTTLTISMNGDEED